MDKVVYVYIEYGCQNLSFGFVFAVRRLAVASKSVEFKEIAYEHRERFIKDIAEFSVIEIFGNPQRIILGFIPYISERIVGKLCEKILEQSVYRVNLVGFFLARAGHFAFEARVRLEYLVINRHQNGSDFVGHKHIDYALRIGRHDVNAADKEKNIRRRAAVKLVKNIRAFVSVSVVPLARFFIVSVSADSVGISQEISDKYGVGDIVADIDD